MDPGNSPLPCPTCATWIPWVFRLWHSSPSWWNSVSKGLFFADVRCLKKKTPYTNVNEKWQRNHGTTARIKHVSVPKGCLYKRQACKAWVAREYWGNLANEDWGRGSTPNTDGIAISLWAGALGCHFKAFPTINQRLSSPPATTLLAVPLTTPLNISTMELSLRSLRYTSARQSTFISAYMLHTGSQLIYLPRLRIKEKEWVVAVWCMQASISIM